MSTKIGKEEDPMNVWPVVAHNTPGVFILTKEQCSLIADALDIIEPEDDDAAAQAEALAIQFRNASE